MTAVSRLVTLATITTAIIFPTSFATAQFGSSPPSRGGQPPVSAERLVNVKLMADTATIQPGQKFHIGVLFEIEPEWHTYWIHPGDSGMATSISVQGPRGFEVGEVLWPRPKIIRTAEGTTYGYEDKVIHFVPVTAPQSIGPGSVPFAVEVRWLVCREVCLMGQSRQSILLSTARSSDDGEGAAPSAEQELIETFKKRLPKPIDEHEDHEYSFDGRFLTIQGPIGEYESAEFFPIELPGVTYSRPGITVEDGRYRVEVEVTVNPRNALGREIVVAAVVGLGRTQDDPSYSIRFTPETGQ